MKEKLEQLKSLLASDEEVITVGRQILADVVEIAFAGNEALPSKAILRLQDMLDARDAVNANLHASVRRLSDQMMKISSVARESLNNVHLDIGRDAEVILKDIIERAGGAR